MANGQEVLILFINLLFHSQEVILIINVALYYHTIISFDFACDFRPAYMHISYHCSRVVVFDLYSHINYILRYKYQYMSSVAQRIELIILKSHKYN